MKRINSALITLTILLAACQPGVDRFAVNGQITEADGKMLYLDHMGLDKVEVIDSAKLDAQGKFSFTPAAPQDCFDFYRLRVDRQVINIVIDSTETVTVNAALPSMQTGYSVEGSENSLKLKDLVLRQIGFRQDLRRVSSQYRSPEPAALNARLSEMLEVFKSDINTEFIFPSPASPVAYYALMLSVNGQMLYNPQSDRQDAKCFAAVATQMDLNYPDAVRTKHLHNVALKGMAKTSTTRNAASPEELQAFEDLVVVESGLIEIDLPDCRGVNHKLSDLKGQVVLLDFTAYKTDYSINYNFLLRSLYDKYADQGFNIYQVSVDTDESMWMNSSSNLPWVCVRDEASLQSNYLKLYNVTQIPTVFLMDRNGDIVDRPEDTNSLDAKIADLLRGKVTK